MIHQRDAHTKEKKHGLEWPTCGCLNHALVLKRSLIADFVKIPVFSSSCHLFSMGSCWEGFRVFWDFRGPRFSMVSNATSVAPHTHPPPSQAPFPFVISFTTPTGRAAAEVLRGCYELRVVGCLDPLRPLLGIQDTSSFGCNKWTATMITYVRIPSRPGGPTHLPPSHIAPFIVQSCSNVGIGSEFVGSFKVAEIMYGSDYNYTIFHPPSVVEGWILVVTTHVHGGRSAPLDVSKLYRGE